MKNLTLEELEIMFDDIFKAREAERAETGEIDEKREAILIKIYEAKREMAK